MLICQCLKFLSELQAIPPRSSFSFCCHHFTPHFHAASAGACESPAHKHPYQENDKKQPRFALIKNLVETIKISKPRGQRKHGPVSAPAKICMFSPPDSHMWERLRHQWRLCQLLEIILTTHLFLIFALLSQVLIFPQGKDSRSSLECKNYFFGGSLVLEIP